MLDNCARWTAIDFESNMGLEDVFSSIADNLSWVNRIWGCPHFDSRQATFIDIANYGTLGALQY
jgi:hypothetical protein